MGFNNGSERRKLNAEWERLRVTCRQAGMSEEAIQAMLYEFDLNALNSEHTRQIPLRSKKPEMMRATQTSSNSKKPVK